MKINIRRSAINDLKRISGTYKKRKPLAKRHSFPASVRHIEPSSVCNMDFMKARFHYPSGMSGKVGSLPVAINMVRASDNVSSGS